MIDMTKALVKPVRTWRPTAQCGNTADYIFLASNGKIYDIERGVILQNFGYDVTALMDWVGEGLFEEVTASFGEFSA